MQRDAAGGELMEAHDTPEGMLRGRAAPEVFIRAVIPSSVFAPVFAAAPSKVSFPRADRVRANRWDGDVVALQRPLPLTFDHLLHLLTSAKVSLHYFLEDRIQTNASNRIEIDTAESFAEWEALDEVYKDLPCIWVYPRTEENASPNTSPIKPMAPAASASTLLSDEGKKNPQPAQADGGTGGVF